MHQGPANSRKHDAGKGGLNEQAQRDSTDRVSPTAGKAGKRKRHDGSKEKQASNRDVFARTFVLSTDLFSVDGERDQVR